MAKVDGTQAFSKQMQTATKTPALELLFCNTTLLELHSETLSPLYISVASCIISILWTQSQRSKAILYIGSAHINTTSESNATKDSWTIFADKQTKMISVLDVLSSYHPHLLEAHVICTRTTKMLCPLYEKREA